MATAVVSTRCILAVVLLGGAALLGSTALDVSHAATFGGVAGTTLLGSDAGSSPDAPTVAGCDNFTGVTGATVAARAATVAAACANRVWTVHVGTWTIQSNRAASSSTTNAVATLNTSAATTTAEVVLSSLNTGGRSGGLVVTHNGTATYLAAVMIDGSPDRVELRLYNAGTPTVLTTVYPSFTTTNTLRLSRDNADISLTLNGSAIGAYVLNGTQLTTLAGGARAGLFGGSSSVRYDEFLVTTP